VCRRLLASGSPEDGGRCYGARRFHVSEPAPAEGAERSRWRIGGLDSVVFVSYGGVMVDASPDGHLLHRATARKAKTYPVEILSPDED